MMILMIGDDDDDDNSESDDDGDDVRYRTWVPFFPSLIDSGIEAGGRGECSFPYLPLGRLVEAVTGNESLPGVAFQLIDVIQSKKYH